MDLNKWGKIREELVAIREHRLAYIRSLQEFESVLGSIKTNHLCIEEAKIAVEESRELLNKVRKEAKGVDVNMTRAVELLVLEVEISRATKRSRVKDTALDLGVINGRAVTPKETASSSTPG